MEVLQGFLLILFILLVIAELRWSHAKGQGSYSLGDSAANVTIAVVGALIRPLSVAWTFAVLALVQPYQLMDVQGSWRVYALTFVVVDLAYYGYHRLSHQLPLFWTLHHTHHSSHWFNFTTAIRLNWIARFVSPVYFLPLVLLGLDPLWIAASLALGLIYQLFLHTQSIPRLGWFEGKLLNTPSAHRVHHGRNPEYIDKNFGGVLILWDRLFGTYQPEQEPVRYGVVSEAMGNNPLRIQLAPLDQYLRGEFQSERETHRRRAQDIVRQLQ
ncbi:MAG: sterol desaturase family protein [Xanthomonadales bacterium]|nr:sterol desaturase family protein [Xanthomonadales bacterium]